eukprot:gene24714-biopygen10459
MHTLFSAHFQATTAARNELDPVQERPSGAHWRASVCGRRSAMDCRSASSRAHSAQSLHFQPDGAASLVRCVRMGRDEECEEEGGGGMGGEV